MFRRISILSLILVLSTFFCSAKSTSENNASEGNLESKNNRTLVVGVEDVPFFPLFDFMNSESSFTKDLLDEFASQHNYTFEYLPMPVKKFGMWLFDKDIDLKYPDNKRWNESEVINDLAAKKLTYSKPTLYLFAGTLTLDPKIKSKKDVKILGTLLGFHPTNWVKELESKEVVLYETSSTLVLMQQLLRGQVDAINIEPTVANHYLKKINSKLTVSINRNIKHEVYAYHLSTLKHPEVIKEFNVFLENNAEFIDSLRQRYGIGNPYDLAPTAPVLLNQP